MQVVALRTDLRYSMSSLPKRANAGIAFALFFDYSTNEPQFPYFSSSSSPFHHSFGRNCAMDGVWQHPFLFYCCPIKVQYIIKYDSNAKLSVFEFSFSFYKPPNQKVMVRVLLNLQNSIVRLQRPFSKSWNRIAEVQRPFSKSRNRIAEVQRPFSKSRNAL